MYFAVNNHLESGIGGPSGYRLVAAEQLDGSAVFSHQYFNILPFFQGFGPQPD